MPTRRRTSRRITPASMGPQLYRCGNSACEQGHYPQSAASMGPQLYRCGNKNESKSILRRTNSFNGAATLSLRKFRRRASPSRHHRRCFNGAATLSLRKSGTISLGFFISPCFNGAATLSLRKLGVLGRAVDPLGVASMGPQLYRCGNRPERQRTPADIRHASMGPQLYRCGNGHYRRRHHHCRPRFNGAATLSLRKWLYL